MGPENRGEFYRGIYVRLPPSESNVAIDDGRQRCLTEFTNEELMTVLRRDDEVAVAP